MLSARVAALMSALAPWISVAQTQVRPVHHAYSGQDPALWTSGVLAASSSAPGAFTVFPCDAANCAAAQVITDAQLNTYVVGSRLFASQSADVFIAKLDPGGRTVFLVTLSGKGNDQGRAIALDPVGNVVAGGSTTSPNFPLRNAVQTSPGKGTTGFLVKLSPDGSRLMSSTYFGGNDSSVDAIAADRAGNTWVAGTTGGGVQTTPGMPAGRANGFGPGGTFGAFLSKLSATGDKILSSGVISGNSLACTGGSSCFLSLRSTSVAALALDAAGNAYVAGNSNVTDLPTTDGVFCRNGLGGWVARINESGEKLDYLTYISATRHGGGTYVTAANGISAMVVDREGYAWIAGRANDPKFPPHQARCKRCLTGPQSRSCTARPGLPRMPSWQS